MDLGKGSALPVKIGRIFLICLLCALVLSLLAAFLISRTSMGEARVHDLSAAALFLSSLAGALALGRSGQRKRWLYGLLYSLVLSVIVLMIGFLIASEQMHIGGLLRVLVCCLAGGLGGALLNGGEKTQRQKSRFAFGAKKR